jgi:hypothetical protein
MKFDLDQQQRTFAASIDAALAAADGPGGARVTGDTGPAAGLVDAGGPRRDGADGAGTVRRIDAHPVDLVVAAGDSGTGASRSGHQSIAVAPVLLAETGGAVHSLPVS